MHPRSPSPAFLQSLLPHLQEYQPPCTLLLVVRCSE
jgi:hypothetical protein